MDEATMIATILFEAFVSYKPLYTSEAFAATALSATEIGLRFDEGPTWVAILDNRIIGTIAAMATDRTLYIRSMAVVPDVQGQGIGKMLLEQAEKYGKTKGFKRLQLYTTHFLHEAISLYNRFGFIDKGAEHDLKGTPLILMEKELNG
jgi:GNAT superfamily N-acetyltransferase